MNYLSVAIVTKNRPQSLRQCLAKLEPQCQRLHIPLKIINNLPVPVARNQAIAWCPTEYLAFVDDDCLVNSNYCSVALKTIKAFPKVGFIVGNSLLNNPFSREAVAQYVYQRYWFHQKLKPGNSTGLNLDTKNCILNLKVIKKLHLRFDTKISIHGYDASDTDFGFQLKKYGMIGLYQPKLVLYHQETTGLLPMIRKAYLRGRLTYLLYRKWDLKNELVDLGNQSIIYRVKQLKHLPAEYHRYRTSLSNFTLIKLYQESFFRGFLYQRKLAMHT